MQLTFATNNAHKLAEIQDMLGANFDLLTLEAIGCHEELAETGNTLEANSLQKAAYVWDNFQQSCFADDTGLEITSLGGEPGVYSARYAGEQRNAVDNMNLVLSKLAHHADKSAQFRTVITLILEGKIHQFEGIVKGKMIDTPRGNQGFGYDPIFVPEGHNRTFAEMSIAEKSTLSHRARAFGLLVVFLSNLTH